MLTFHSYWAAGGSNVDPSALGLSDCALGARPPRYLHPISRTLRECDLNKPTNPPTRKYTTPADLHRSFFICAQRNCDAFDSAYAKSEASRLVYAMRILVLAPFGRKGFTQGPPRTVSNSAEIARLAWKATSANAIGSPTTLDSHWRRPPQERTTKNKLEIERSIL